VDGVDGGAGHFPGLLGFEVAVDAGGSQEQHAGLGHGVPAFLGLGRAGRGGPGRVRAGEAAL
jgi:hypothetical protein